MLKKRTMWSWLSVFNSKRRFLKHIYNKNQFDVWLGEFHLYKQLCITNELKRQIIKARELIEKEHDEIVSGKREKNRENYKTLKLQYKALTNQLEQAENTVHALQQKKWGHQDERDVVKDLLSGEKIKDEILPEWDLESKILSDNNKK